MTGLSIVSIPQCSVGWPPTHPEYWVEPSDTRELYIHTQSTGWNLVTPGNSIYTPIALSGT